MLQDNGMSKRLFTQNPQSLENNSKNILIGVFLFSKGNKQQSQDTKYTIGKTFADYIHYKS